MTAVVTPRVAGMVLLVIAQGRMVMEHLGADITNIVTVLVIILMIAVTIVLIGTVPAVNVLALLHQVQGSVAVPVLGLSAGMVPVVVQDYHRFSLTVVTALTGLTPTLGLTPAPAWTAASGLLTDPVRRIQIVVIIVTFDLMPHYIC